MPLPRQVEAYLAEQMEKEEGDEQESSDAGADQVANLSPAMSEFLGGVTYMPRFTVVKKLWEYIKGNELQNPANRRKIILDETLSKLFKPPVDAFSINKQISKHVFAAGAYVRAPLLFCASFQVSFVCRFHAFLSYGFRAMPGALCFASGAALVARGQRYLHCPQLLIASLFVASRGIARIAPTNLNVVGPAGKRKSSGAGAKRKATASGTGKASKKAKAEEGGPKKASGFCLPIRISEELGALVGGTEMTRAQLSKAMHAYFNENNLKDSDDKRYVNCDDKLKALFKVDRFMAFGVAKYLEPHIVKVKNE